MSDLVMPSHKLVLPQGVVHPSKKFEFSSFEDDKKEIFDKLGDLEDIDLWYGAVLVAKWIRNTIGTGALLAAEDTKKEDLYQSKVGLVLKVGPLAFKDRPGADFGGANLNPGDWVMYRMSDGTDTAIRCLDGINVIHAKILEDAECKGVLKSPDRVW